MEQTGFLFDVLERDVDREPEAPPHNGTPTSKAAAESMVGHAGRLLKLVVDTIRAAGPRGMTCDEVEVATGLSHQCASARINQAAKGGLLVQARDDKGEVIKRPTRSRRGAVVWVAADPTGVTGP